LPQSLAKVDLHVIFSTKDREPVLADEWRDELFRVLGGTINNLGCQSLVVGGVADHVHLLFQLGRTIAIADAVGKIKSTSSAWVNQNHRLSDTFHWQAGYGAFSVS
jgi:putative transposase